MLDAFPKYDKGIKIELRHPNAKLPIKANPHDAGADLTAVDFKINEQYIEYDLGLAIEIPKGYAGLIYPRSSISKYDLILANGVGVIDFGFFGNLTVRFKLTKDLDNAKIYNIGDRIGQLIIVPIQEVEYYEVETISGNRGGWGSSGV